MNFAIHFGCLLVVLLLGGLIMACEVRDAQLTADERQCCKEMGGDCGQGASGMPMSHSCCQTSVQPPHDFRPSSTFSSSTPYLVISAVDFPPVVVFGEQSGRFASWFRPAPSPPLAKLDASAPLRI